MELRVVVTREANGDFAVSFPHPFSDPDTPYEMVKLSLLAAEIREYAFSQCIIVNTDADNRMLLLSERIVDHDGFYEDLKRRRTKKEKVVTDVDRLQTKLPFEEKINGKDQTD